MELLARTAFEVNISSSGTAVGRGKESGASGIYLGLPSCASVVGHPIGI